MSWSPSLELLSVESAVGWIPSYREGADWLFINSEARKEHPEYDLLPSEYFKRQIYGCFWFECEGLRSAFEQLPDDLLWETDFPHPTCQHAGLARGLTQHPADDAERAFAGVPEATIEKVLHAAAWARLRIGDEPSRHADPRYRTTPVMSPRAETLATRSW